MTVDGDFKGFAPVAHLSDAGAGILGSPLGADIADLQS